MKIDRCWAKR